MQRSKRHLWPVIALLLVFAVTLTACGGGGGVEGLASRATGIVARVIPQMNLPRITVSYDDSGVPTIFGIKTTSLPINLGFVQLSPATLDSLKSKNIQHAELDTTPDGMFVYVNGKALPYVGWNADRLKYMGDLLDRLDVVGFDRSIANVLPLLGKLGIDVVIQFPPASDATAIPLRERSQRVPAEDQEIGEPQAVIQALIQYDENGVPSIADVTIREIGDLAETDLSAVELPASTMQKLTNAGVQQATIMSAGDGLHVLVNEQELLLLAYNEQHLTNAIDVYGQVAGDQKGEALAELLTNLEPIIYGADIDLVVQFPGSQ